MKEENQGYCFQFGKFLIVCNWTIWKYSISSFSVLPLDSDLSKRNRVKLRKEKDRFGSIPWGEKKWQQ